MKDINMIYEWAMDIVEKCDIETGTITNVTINTRAKKRWGQCRKSGGTYTININADILADDVPYKPVLETMIHEILHTCRGCFNHGAEWKRMAEIIKRETGYNITRCTSAETFGINREPKRKEGKYVLVCEKCGKEITRERMSNFVKHPEWYSHKDCGGKFKRIK